MSRKGKMKPPDSRSRLQKISRPADGPASCGDGPDSGAPPYGVATKMGPSPSLLSRWAVPAVCAFLLLAVALVFGQTIRHEFINYDDPDYVYDNPPVAGGLAAAGIVWAFTHFHSGNWHPLTWLSHMLDCQLYGLHHPGGHHLTNVLLHAASALLLFLVLRGMTGDLWPSAFAATLFAIHPLHVESVAWVAERKDVLSGLFFMLTLAAYAGYARRPFSLLRYLLTTALFVLGLMAKPMLATLPFVLLLLDYWPLGRIGATTSRSREQSPLLRQGPSAIRRVLLEKLPWLALAAVSCTATYLAQSSAGAVVQRLPFPSRIANALICYVAYLGQFFCPLGLAVFYPYLQNSLPIWKVIASLALLVGISLAAMAGRRKCPYLLVGWLWHLGMLVPVIGLVQVGSQAMADRYTYLPQIGLYIALAWGAERVSRHWPYRCWVVGAAAALAVMSLAWCAWQQASYWKNSETLWRHALACTSKNWLAEGNSAILLAGRGRVDEAIDHYLEALKIKPDYELAHSNLGVVLAGCGRVDEAIAHYHEALKITPDDALAHNNLGDALASQGRADEAIDHYQKALETKPDFAEAQYNLGVVLATHGRSDEAIDHYQKALKIKPDYAEAHSNLGAALAGRGRLDEAVAHYRRALEIKPDNAEIRNNLGNALANRGQVNEAIAEYRKALEIKPDYAGAQNNLALALAGCGRVDEAIANYQAALKINPDNVNAHRNLAVVASGRKKILAALAQRRELLRSRPQDATLLNDTAWLLATDPNASFRNGPEAVELAQRANKLSDGKRPEILATLAAAYAEAGRFVEAGQTAQKALDLAAQQSNQALAESIQAKIRLYEAAKPFHESLSSFARTAIQSDKAGAAPPLTRTQQGGCQGCDLRAGKPPRRSLPPRVGRATMAVRPSGWAAFR